MSTLFPIAELLTIAVFASSVAAVLTEAAPRPRRILVDRVGVDDLLVRRGAREASRTEADFPSTGVC